MTYAFIGGLSISQITFVGPLVTYCNKRIGTHPTLAIGLVLETGALIASSFVTKTWQLFLTQGAVFGWGAGFLYVGSIGIIPQWFSKRRSLASAIAAAGSGIGGMSYCLGSQAMIEDISLAWCFRISAIVAFTINSCCILVIRDRNKYIDPNQRAFDLSLLKNFKLILIILWGWFSTLGYTIILFSLPDNALKIGLSAWQAAIVGAMANLGMAIGRPIVGYFSDHVGRLNMICLASALSSIFSFCIWTSGNTYAVLLVFAIVGGTMFGTFYGVSCHRR